MKHKTLVLLLWCVALCLRSFGQGQAGTPNLYKLHDGTLTVTYSNIAGKPHFMYEGQQQQQIELSGDEVRTVSTNDVGTLVSVSTQIGDTLTTFTLLVPHVTLAGNQSVAIKTLGIITVHKPSASNRGQLDSYALHNLAGTAEFLAAGK